MKIIINPKYNHLTPHIKKWCSPTYFSSHGECIHSGRNILKIFEHEGRKYVVKSYSQMTTFNRIIYGRLRKSKAHRAYIHAIRLKNIGIDTPEHIAVVDIRKGLKLYHSYFISLYTDYLPSSQLTENFTKDTSLVDALDDLSKFLSSLHRKGIIHKDLNINNILYHTSASGEYLFSLIDTNRMSFHSSLSERERIHNLKRLSCSTVAYTYILERYAYHTKGDSLKIQFIGFISRAAFEVRVWYKQRIKKIIKKLLNLHMM